MHCAHTVRGLLLHLSNQAAKTRFSPLHSSQMMLALCNKCLQANHALLHIIVVSIGLHALHLSNGHVALVQVGGQHLQHLANVLRVGVEEWLLLGLHRKFCLQCHQLGLVRMELLRAGPGLLPPIKRRKCLLYLPSS